MAEEHEVIDILPSVEEQPPDGTVRHFVVHQRDGPEVQPHQLLDIFHLLVEGHLELLEDLRHHARPHHFVAVESPAQTRHIPLAHRLADIVQQRRPVEPQIGLLPGFLLEPHHIVQHLQRMAEILLMSLTVNCFHALELAQLRQELLQQAGLQQLLQRPRRMRRHEHLVQLLHNAFLRQNLQSSGHSPHGRQ